MTVDVLDPTREQTIRLQPITSLGELQRYGIEDLETVATAEAPKRKLPILMILMVIVPVILGATYNFIISSDRYVSTASFVIRESDRGSILSVAGASGMTRSDDDSYAIAEYVTSRDVVDSLSRNEGLGSIFDSEEVDFFSRFPTALTGASREDFYDHFQHYVSFDFNSSTGISTLSVQAFSPQDANRLNNAMLAKAEELVNDLNRRPRTDAVDFAAKLVDEATLRLATAQAKLTAYRNSQQIINPDSEVTIANLLMTELLRSLSETNAQISQLTAAARDNPRLQELELRRDALLKNIDAQRSQMTGSAGSLALKMEGFDTIRIERDLAEKSLTTAVNSLDVAKQDAQKGHLYLERVVEPSVPDRYGYPKRYLNMLLIIGVCWAIYWITRKTIGVFVDEPH